MTRLTRSDLDALPAYVPGRSVPGAIKLASNEVPYGPLPGVVDAIIAASSAIDRYPDMGVSALRAAIAARLGIDGARIVTGCGSVALAEHLVRATCLPGDEVVHAWRSFEAYPIITATTAVTGIRVPNADDHTHDLPAMAKTITERTRVVLVCNPNNPTGTASTRSELDAFINDVPADVLIVLDEAYREFVTDPSVPDGVVSYGDRPNVAVLRTFSKAWGLAGLRVGYLVAHPPVAAAVRKVLTPFSTSSLAQAAALAALRAEAEMRRRADLILVERQRVLAAVQAVVPGVPTTQANFVWLPLGQRSIEFSEMCEQAGVIVRPFAGEGVRVTIGKPEENDAMLAALATWGTDPPAL
ncbi:MAG: histidinol-phosphate transaminase [Micromonosporaceae bacterium]|nr:histidinol-phosphate transaminase [Micromonosporaceae bacterium]